MNAERMLCAGTQDERPSGLPSAGAKAGGYVPPSLRNRMGGGEGESMQVRAHTTISVQLCAKSVRSMGSRERGGWGLCEDLSGQLLGLLPARHSVDGGARCRQSAATAWWPTGLALCLLHAVSGLSGCAGCLGVQGLHLLSDEGVKVGRVVA